MMVLSKNRRMTFSLHPENIVRGWINIYRNKTNGESFCGKIYESEEEAKAQTDVLTTIKIEWEE